MKYNKIKTEIIYIQNGKRGKGSNIKALLKMLFTDFAYFYEHEKALNYYKKKIQKEKTLPGVVALDCRENEISLEQNLDFIEKIYDCNRHPRVLIIYNDRLQNNIYKFSDLGVEYLLRDSRNAKTIHKMITRLAADFGNIKVEKKSSDTASAKKEIEKYKEILHLKENFFISKTREFDRMTGKIMTSNRLLTRISPNKKQLEYINKTKHYCEIFRSTIKEILDFLETDSNEYDIENKTFNINVVLDNITSMIWVSMKEKGAELIFDISNNVPAMIIGDPYHLGQAVTNLINAINVIGGSGEIILKLSKNVVNEVIKTLKFEIIFTTSESMIKENENIETLYNDNLIYESKEMIEAMGGSLSVTKNGDDHKIIFSVPMEQTERRSYHLPSKKWMSSRVLIMEKRESVGRALSSMLQYFHFDTTYTPSIREGLKLMHFKIYDLIFVEEKTFIMLSGEFNSMKKNARIILTENEWEKRGKKDLSKSVMADTFLTKPFTHQRIFDIILELHAIENSDKNKENLDILKENLRFLAQGKKIIYLGHDFAEKTYIETLIENTGIFYLALDNFSDLKLDIKLVDMFLLDMDSFDEEENKKIISTIKKNSGNRIPVTIITYPEKAEQLENIGYLKMENVMIKPIDPEKFYRHLMEYFVI